MAHSAPEQPADEASFRETHEAVADAGHRSGIGVERFWRCDDVEAGLAWELEIVLVGSADGGDCDR